MRLMSPIDMRGTVVAPGDLGDGVCISAVNVEDWAIGVMEGERWLVSPPIVCKGSLFVICPNDTPVRIKIIKVRLGM